nr:MAG TPA: hypothetical protein [Caudoviricetes sp.]
MIQVPYTSTLYHLERSFSRNCAIFAPIFRKVIL